jgi:hypothetical protein
VDISDLEVNRLRLLSDRLIDVRPLGGVRLSKNCHLNRQREHLFESNGFTARYGQKDQDLFDLVGQSVSDLLCATDGGRPLGHGGDPVPDWTSGCGA